MEICALIAKQMQAFSEGEGKGIVEVAFADGAGGLDDEVGGGDVDVVDVGVGVV